MLADSLAENLEGKIWYFGLHINLNYQETINLQVYCKAVIHQEQFKPQAVRQR